MALTTLPSLPAGHVPSAAEYAALLAAVAELQPLVAVAQLDKSVSSANTGVTLVDDDYLYVTLPAVESIWTVDLRLWYVAATGGDIKLGWSAPVGCELAWNMRAPASNETTVFAPQYWARNTLAGTDTAAGTGVEMGVNPFGVLKNPGVGGLFRFRRAQGAANATNTTVLANSTLTLRRIK